MGDFEKMKAQVEELRSKFKKAEGNQLFFGEKALKDFASDLTIPVQGISAALKIFVSFYDNIGCTINGDHITPVTIFYDQDCPNFYPYVSGITLPTSIQLEFFLANSELPSLTNIKELIHIYFDNKGYEFHYEIPGGGDIRKKILYGHMLPHEPHYEFRDAIVNSLYAKISAKMKE
jgi:hypothetical protein